MELCYRLATALKPLHPLSPQFLQRCTVQTPHGMSLPGQGFETGNPPKQTIGQSGDWCTLTGMCIPLFDFLISKSTESEMIQP
jgi:hypothetical protein